MTAGWTTRLAGGARWIAIAIAVAGVIDPVVVARRAVRADIAVVAEGGAEAAILADRIASELTGRFTVARGPDAGAAAIVVAGRAAPDVDVPPGTLAFAVRPTGPEAPAIARLTAPARARMDAAVPVLATIDTTGVAGSDRIEVTLEDGGVAVDRQILEIPAGASRLDARLTWVPARTGAAAIRVRARAAGAPGAADAPDARDAAASVADLGIEVTDTPYRVLFFERRPSWTSTFVRRAVELDRRFAVTSRVGTSRGVSTSTGPAPESLADAAVLDDYDVVVCGAPDALTPADVRGLTSFARERGGTVVLLLEQADAGAAAALSGVGGWTAWSEPDGLEATPAGTTGTLRATEVGWPTGQTSGLDPLVTWARGSGAGPRTLVWRAQAGLGAVVTSALFDAWRFRADSTGFDDFWRLTLAEAAARAPAPVEVRLDRGVAAPGDDLSIRVHARGETAAPAGGASGSASGASNVSNVSGVSGVSGGRVAFSASLIDEAGAATPVTLWPGDVGAFDGTIRAPGDPGAYRVVVTVGETRGEAAFVVRPDARAAGQDAGDRLAAWTHAHGGRVLSAEESSAIATTLEAALPAEARDAAWHPMRHPAWIVPFAGLLGIEWWHRRRRGLG